MAKGRAPTLAVYVVKKQMAVVPSIRQPKIALIKNLFGKNL
jgi:hypothetical protein